MPDRRGRTQVKHVISSAIAILRDLQNGKMSWGQADMVELERTLDDLRRIRADASPVVLETLVRDSE